MLVKLTPLVNITNILRAAFLYKSFAPSFFRFVYYFGARITAEKLIKNCWWNWHLVGRHPFNVEARHWGVPQDGEKLLKRRSLSQVQPFFEKSWPLLKKRKQLFLIIKRSSFFEQCWECHQVEALKDVVEFVPLLHRVLVFQVLEEWIEHVVKGVHDLSTQEKLHCLVTLPKTFLIFKLY